MEAATDFLEWTKIEDRAHPNSGRRIASSLTGAKQFFRVAPVARIDEGEIEGDKVFRGTEHKVCDVTIRHDLHALSMFLKCAIKQKCTRENPIRNLKTPADPDAVRIHVISREEEKEYFKRAAKNRNGASFTFGPANRRQLAGLLTSQLRADAFWRPGAKGHQCEFSLRVENPASTSYA
jgi:site-specific recombinase XerD